MKRDMQLGKSKAHSGNSETSLARAMVLDTDSTNHWESFRNLWRCITVIWWMETKDASCPVMQGTVLHIGVFHIPHDFWKTHQEFE